MALLLAQLSTLNPQLRAADVVWTNTAGGNWGTATNWSPNQVPGSADTVWITNSGTYTVTINTAASAAAIQIGASSGSQTLSLGGTLSGATVTAATGGAALAANGGTLNGVTLAADVSIGDRKSLTVANGLTLAGATITVYDAGFNGTYLYAAPGTQTIGGTGQIVLTGTYASRLTLGNGAGTTLTLGPGVTVRGQGTIGQFYASTLINEGTIQADVPSQTLTVAVSSFSNGGALRAINNGRLNVSGLVAGMMGGTLELVGSGSAVTLSGSGYALPASGVVVTAGQTLTLDGTWSNTGTLTLDGGTVNLGGTFTQAGLGVFNRIGGTVNLTGTLNGGLTLDAATGSWNVSGTINGGTVMATGGAALAANGGTLNGVTLAADVSIGDRKSLTVANGLTLAGATITVYDAGFNGTYLYAAPGTQTIGGTGQIVLTGTYASRLTLGNGAGTTLTLGPGVTVRGQGTIGQFYASTLINQGTIQADVPSQTLTVAVSSFSSSGTVKALAGTLGFSTAFTQTTGSTLLQGGTLTASSTMQFLGGLLAGTGTITANVNSSATVSPGASPGLLTISGNYTQAVGGVLNIELAGLTPGTGFDRLAVTGTASLAGALNVTLTNGFYPPTNANFSFLTAATRSGTFNTFNYPSSDVGMQVNYTSTNASAQVINVRPVLPVWAGQTNDELVLFNLNAAGTDDDQPPQTLTYALTNAPAGSGIDPGTGLISWTPTEAQGPMTTNITVLVTDNGTPNLTVARTFAITVNEINVPPALALPPDQPINEQAPFAALATATDSDVPANTWAFELVSGPGGLSVASDGAIAWTPGEDQGPGVYPVSVRVTDTNTNALNEQSLSKTNTFTLTVREVNLPPLLTVPTNQVLVEETALSVSASATDPDVPANGLTFALLSPPAGMAIDTNSGAITWTPTEAQGPGSNYVEVVVTDLNTNVVNEQQFSVTNSFSVLVNEVNVAPLVGPLSDYTVNPGQTISFTATATDEDLPVNGLGFSLVNPPAGAGISGSGLFEWRPRVTQAGTTNVVAVRVGDDGAPALGGTNMFTVIVNPLTPVLLNPLGLAGGEFSLEVIGMAGPDYVILASSNLTDWLDLATNLAPSSPFQFHDPTAGTFSNRAYRVRLEP